MDRNIFLAKWLHQFDAKRLSRPSEGSVFLRPIMAIRRLLWGGYESPLNCGKSPCTVSYHIEISSIKENSPSGLKRN